jgi:hypothetical protein
MPFKSNLYLEKNESTEILMVSNDIHRAFNCLKLLEQPPWSAGRVYDTEIMQLLISQPKNTHSRASNNPFSYSVSIFVFHEAQTASKSFY